MPRQINPVKLAFPIISPTIPQIVACDAPLKLFELSIELISLKISFLSTSPTNIYNSDVPTSRTAWSAVPSYDIQILVVQLVHVGFLIISRKFLKNLNVLTARSGCTLKISKNYLSVATNFLSAQQVFYFWYCVKNKAFTTHFSNYSEKINLKPSYKLLNTLVKQKFNI